MYFPILLNLILSLFISQGFLKDIFILAKVSDTIFVNNMIRRIVVVDILIIVLLSKS